jgi:predicted CXXCH cytochrome family protein
MKKSLVFLTFFLVVMFPLAAMAAVSGVCSNCHTMHNSQGGEPMVFGEGVVGPLSALLRSDCMGCHTTTGTDPLATPGGAEGLYPFVMASAEGAFNDDNCLAGGFFNPDTVGNQDNNSDMNHTLGTTASPAGYDGTKFPYALGYQNNEGLGCAGSNGCHGVHDVLDDMEAIKGGHHAPSGAYRMLFVDNDMAADGVLGVGAVDYENAIIGTDGTAPVTDGENQNVNIYSAGENDPSISELCAICHGVFHGDTETGGASPWLRHPTDFIIPGETNGTPWPIAGTGSAGLTQSDYKNNPVGYDDANDSGDRRVTCLSCHRAHGTENPDLLRWDYATQSAGNGVTYGCLGCHVRQQ